MNLRSLDSTRLPDNFLHDGIDELGDDVGVVAAVGVQVLRMVVAAGLAWQRCVYADLETRLIKKMDFQPL